MSFCCCCCCCMVGWLFCLFVSFCMFGWLFDWLVFQSSYVCVVFPLWYDFSWRAVNKWVLFLCLPGSSLKDAKAPLSLRRPPQHEQWLVKTASLELSGQHSYNSKGQRDSLCNSSYYLYNLRERKPWQIW